MVSEGEMLEINMNIWTRHVRALFDNIHSYMHWVESSILRFISSHFDVTPSRQTMFFFVNPLLSIIKYKHRDSLAYLLFSVSFYFVLSWQR